MACSAAALTMCAPSDGAFLKLWLAHYGKALGGAEHLYIVQDGQSAALQQLVQQEAPGASLINLPLGAKSQSFEKQRWWVLQQFSEILGAQYDAVICGDVDELIAPAPALGTDLLTYLDAQPKDPPHISPLGLELVQMGDEPTAFDPTRPVLTQRRYGRLNSKYAKPSIRFDPSARRLKPGSHIWHNGPWNIHPGLILFHLKAFDDKISAEIADSRQARVAAIEADGADKNAHGIRGWQEGDKQLSEMRLWMESRIADMQDWDSFDLDALLSRYDRRRQKIKRCPSIQSGPLRLGADWQQVI